MVKNEVVILLFLWLTFWVIIFLIFIHGKLYLCVGILSVDWKIPGISFCKKVLGIITNIVRRDVGFRDTHHLLEYDKGEHLISDIDHFKNKRVNLSEYNR